MIIMNTRVIISYLTFRQARSSELWTHEVKFEFYALKIYHIMLKTKSHFHQRTGSQILSITESEQPNNFLKFKHCITMQIHDKNKFNIGNKKGLK